VRTPEDTLTRHISRGFRRLLAVVVLIGFACACAGPGEQTEPPTQMSFADRPPIRLNVDRLVVESNEAVPRPQPDIASDFPVPPEAAMEQWAKDRLRAQGHGGVARFRVLTASVSEDRLPRRKGFVGLFGAPPGARDTVTVEGRLEIVAEDGSSAMASAKVVRASTLEGDATRAERQRFRYDLVASTMDAFDGEMERAIRKHLNPWVL
jgi:hypothetical protein